MPLKASCHCGAVQLQVDGELPSKLTRCTCTFCAKRGALLAYFKPEQLRVEAEEACDRVYRWQTQLVAHHFCGGCGCATFSDSPDFQRDGSWDGKTRRIGLNARIIDDFDADAAAVEVIDGRNLW